MVGKGILLELEGRKAVVLTPQGEFQRVPVPRGNWEIGDEISFADATPVPWARWGLTAAAAVLMLVLAPVGYQRWALAQPVAFVTVDINPSLQLTLNKRDEVLKAQGMNSDGVLVLQGVEWERRPLAEVVAAVTERAIEEHKLDVADPASAVVVAVAPAKEENLPEQLEASLVTTAEVAVKATVEQNAKAKNVSPVTNVTAVGATAQEWKEAKEKGLNPGQLFLLQEIQATVPEVEVKPEDLKDKGVRKILKELEVSPSVILGGVEKHHSPKADPAAKGKGGENQEPVQQANEKQHKDNAGKGKSEQAPGQNQGAKPDDTGKDSTDSKDSKDSRGSEDVKENKDDKSRSDDKRRDDKDEKGEEKKDDGKKDTWKVPVLGIEIPKPDFLKGDKKQDSTPKNPRAESPGAGSPADDDRRPDPKPEDNGKGPEHKEEPEDKRYKPSGSDKGPGRGDGDRRDPSGEERPGLGDKDLPGLGGKDDKDRGSDKKGFEEQEKENRRKKR